VSRQAINVQIDYRRFVLDVAIENGWGRVVLPMVKHHADDAVLNEPDCFISLASRWPQAQQSHIYST
jgi:hypothetical protein